MAANSGLWGKEEVLKRDNYTCQYCGKGTTGVDHVIPWNFKQIKTLDNLVVCCQQCNSIAGDKVFHDFYEKKIFILERRIQKGYPIYLAAGEEPQPATEPQPKKRAQKAVVKKRIYPHKERAQEPGFCMNCQKPIIKKVPWQKFCKEYEGDNRCHDQYHSKKKTAQDLILLRLVNLEIRMAAAEGKIENEKIKGENHGK